MNKIKAQNKRAFTLTELLIVVIVIGVLSAVTLPKFNRVIENRKVTEAEEMMSAVRTEQERRCSMDQNYTTKFSNLQDIIASNTTKNYTYSLQKQGISAKSNNADYTLKILSYEDGSYCCEGDGCKKLNKNYPACAGLSFPESSCAGTESGEDGLGPDPEGKECTDGEVQGSQTCNGCGTQTTQLCVNGKWTDSLGTCSKTEEECNPGGECLGPKPASTEKCEPCGEIRRRSVTCGETGEWITGDWNKECKEYCHISCYTASAEGELYDICRSHNMFPVLYPSAEKGFSVEKCCYKCPDNCVEKDGKCVTASEWEAVQDSSSNWLAVRYAPYDDPTGEKTTTYHMGTLDKSPTELIQYGGTDSGGQCNFSVKDAVAVSQDNLIEQNQVANMCSKKCGSKQECDAVIYAKRGGDWLTWIKGYVGGDTACKLQPGITMSDLFTQKFYYTTNMIR